MPNLIEVQKDSYQWFLDEGLKEVFADISPIEDYSMVDAITGNLFVENKKREVKRQWRKTEYVR